MIFNETMSKNHQVLMMIKRSFLLLFVLTVFIGKQSFAQSADLIITNANIITAEKKGVRQQALAVKDGIIIFVGDNKKVLALKKQGTKIIDAKGNTIIPGLNDVHLHPNPETPFSQPDHLIRLDTVTSMKSLVDLLKRKAAITPRGMLIRGRGYNESKIGGQPTRDILDNAGNDHPILLTHASGHMSAANSYLLLLNGINKLTPDPPGGAFDRFNDGMPNGICKESASKSLSINSAIIQYPAITAVQELDNYREYFKKLLSFGITSIGDAGCDTGRLKIYKKLAGDNFPMRFNIMMVDRLLPEMEGGDIHHETDEFKILSYFNSGTIKQVETNSLRVKSIKVFHGNSLSGKTCWLYEPYHMINPASGKNDYYGIPYKRTQEQLDSLFLAIHKKGLQICVHSNGDREIDMVLNSLEKVYATGNPLHLHHRIEHCSVVNDKIIDRIKKLHVIPVLHSYINELGGLLEPYGEDRLNRMFATKSFLDAGVLPAIHSDAPVAGFDARMRWESVVMRTTSEGKILGASQCVDAEDALIMFTKGGAEATEEGNKKGTLSKGKLADFVMIEEDPTRIAPDQLHNLHIRQTWFAGKIVFTDNSK